MTNRLWRVISWTLFAIGIAFVIMSCATLPLNGFLTAVKRKWFYTSWTPKQNKDIAGIVDAEALKRLEALPDWHD